MRDLRDPKAMGEMLFWVREQLPYARFSHLAANARPLEDVRDYRDETTIQKYGRPQELPSTLPN